MTATSDITVRMTAFFGEEGLRRTGRAHQVDEVADERHQHDLDHGAHEADGKQKGEGAPDSGLDVVPR